MIRLTTVLYIPFSREAFNTFYSGLKVMFYGMSTVLTILFLFYIIVKLLIKFFPYKE